MIIVEDAIELIKPHFKRAYDRWRELNDRVQLSIAFAILFLVAIQFWKTNSPDGFGLNAFTELLGVLITVIVVNNIYEKRDEKRRLPTRILVYRESAAMVNRIVVFWAKIHSAVSTDPVPKASELLNQENIAALSQRLDLTGPCPHTSTSWFEYLDREISIVSSYHSRMLNQYATYLSPRNLALIHEISDDSVFTRGNLKSMSDQWNEMITKYAGNPTKMPTSLSVVLPAPNYTYTNMADLHEWLQKEFNELTKMGCSWLEPPSGTENTGNGGKATAALTSHKRAIQDDVPELVPQWKDVFGWQKSHPGNWWLRENENFNNPIVVRHG